MDNLNPAHLERSLDAAIKGLHERLVEASDAAREIATLNPPKDDEDAEYDRIMWLGTVTDGLSVLCTPKLRILAAVLAELANIAEPAERRDTAH